DSLGWYYYKTGQFVLALKELNVAFKHAPGDVEILKHLAMVHKELKNFNQARTFIDQALGQAKFEDERQKILAVKERIETDRLPAS
ncbi:tetratricopeptide repeat protein, partial [Streptococcus pyogenes]